MPAGAFGGDQRGSTPTKRIKNDAVSPTAIADKIRDQRHWLDGRMQSQIAAARWMQAVDARAADDIGPISALTAKTKIVYWTTIATFEHRDQLVLGAIKAALTGIGLVPDQKVFPFGVLWPGGAQEIRQVPPVDEQEVDGAITSKGNSVTDEYRLRIR